MAALQLSFSLFDLPPAPAKHAPRKPAPPPVATALEPGTPTTHEGCRYWERREGGMGICRLAYRCPSLALYVYRADPACQRAEPRPARAGAKTKAAPEVVSREPQRRTRCTPRD